MWSFHYKTWQGKQAHITSGQIDMRQDISCLLEAEVLADNPAGCFSAAAVGSFVSWTLNESEHCSPAVQWVPTLGCWHICCSAPRLSPSAPSLPPHSLRIFLHWRAVKHHTAANPQNSKVVIQQISALLIFFIKIYAVWFYLSKYELHFSSYFGCPTIYFQHLQSDADNA